MHVWTLYKHKVSQHDATRITLLSKVDLSERVRVNGLLPPSLLLQWSLLGELQQLKERWSWLQ